MLEVSREEAWTLVYALSNYHSVNSSFKGTVRAMATEMDRIERG